MIPIIEPISISTDPTRPEIMRKMSKQGVAIWRSLGIQKPLFVLGLLCVVILLATFTKLNSFKSLLAVNCSSCNDVHFHDIRTTQAKTTLDIVVRKIQSRIDQVSSTNSSESLTQRSFLADILGLLESVRESLPIAVPATGEAKPPLSRGEPEEHFLVEELRKYVKPKPNRLGKRNFMGANATFTSIGHACFAGAAMKEDLERYMTYDVGDFCEDDWPVAQRLMLHGCDPLPRRRCFARAPRLYAKPEPSGAAAWATPDDRNVRWSHYRCKGFACLARNVSTRGFFKCSDCFDFETHESRRWVSPGNESDFLAREVVDVKPGEIRIGLDFGVSTGTFAARMRELNVTVVTATVNLGAPFSETIALRGEVPLYVTVNQRLPFFDNTLDLVHTAGFLDGWIDVVVLDFVLYDWDRVLRPGGLLWIDSFFCLKEDLDDYLDSFKMLRYKRHKWVVVPKLDRNDREVFFSALLEKPPRPFR